MGGWSSQVSFHFLLSAPPPPFWGWRRACRVGHYAGGRDRSLDMGGLNLEACRRYGGLDFKTWRLDDK